MCPTLLSWCITVDCDIDAAVSTSVRSSFTNSGQICLCGSRILVQKGIRDLFEKKFIEETQKLQIGPPEDRNVTMGSLISLDHRDKVESYTKIAIEEGGSVLYGGTRRPTEYLADAYKQGAYIEPLIIGGLSYTSKAAQEEVFGPFVTLHAFEDEQDAIEQANSVKYGLSASIWTQDLGRAHRMASLIDAGIVWVNAWLIRDLRTPFGGMKASGVGREGGRHSLDFFSEPKNVYIHMPKTSGPKATAADAPTLNRLTDPAAAAAAAAPVGETGIHVSDAPAPVGAYPHARRHGDFLFLSGIGPRQAASDSIPGGPIENADGTKNDEYDIEAQTRAVIENVKLILEKSGSSLDKVVDVQVFLVDMKRDFHGFNKVYKEYFEALNATRTTCAIRALPTPIAVEFKVVASAK